jgi:hypothetical protein
MATPIGDFILFSLLLAEKTFEKEFEIPVVVESLDRDSKERFEAELTRAITIQQEVSFKLRSAMTIKQKASIRFQRAITTSIKLRRSGCSGMRVACESGAIERDNQQVLDKAI